jgi:predicted nucleic acid-binding protein
MLYLDASVLVASYLVEARSAEAEAVILNEPECLLSDLGLAEAKNAIIRRGKRGEVLADDIDLALASIDEHLQQGWYRLVPVGRSIFADSVTMARRSPVHLRTLDALHLALVSTLRCPLATFDQDLAIAARAEGMTVVP